MPAGTPAVGYRAKAAFRIVGYTDTDGYPVALGTPTPGTLGPYDLLPFTKEAISEDIQHLLDDDLQGYSASREMNQVARMAGGSIDLQGRFLGLNQLILACMGHEQIDDGYGNGTWAGWKRYGGASPIGLAVNSSTNDTLTILGDTFPTTVVGEFVFVSTALGGIAQTRRIIARPSTTQIQVYPAWSTNPSNGDGFAIARAFKHNYECSRNMHQELLSDLGTTLESEDWDGYLTRWGVLGIDKGVSVWESQAVYVESLTFKLDTNGLSVTAELIPFWRDKRTTGRNSSSSTWGFHPESYAVTRRIHLPDSTFWLLTHQAENEEDGHKLGISSFELKIKNNLKADEQSTASGLYRIEPGRDKKREVTGSFTLPRYSNDTQLNLVPAGTLQMAHLQCLGPDLTSGGSDYAALHFYLRALKLVQGDAPADKPGMLGQKFNFTCLQPPSASGGDDWPTPSTGAENGELIITSYDHNPFNYLLGQHTSAY